MPYEIPGHCTSREYHAPHAFDGDWCAGLAAPSEDFERRTHRQNDVATPDTEAWTKPLPSTTAYVELNHDALAQRVYFTSWSTHNHIDSYGLFPELP